MFRKGEGQGNPLVEQFIARKADILFCPAWKTATHQEEGNEEEEPAAGVCQSDLVPVCFIKICIHTKTASRLISSLSRFPSGSYKACRFSLV